MAIKKVIDIDVNAKNAIGELDHLAKSFEAVYGEVQPLSGRTGELEDRLYELALAGKQNTKEFKDLSAEVAKAKRVIVDVDMAVDGMSQTMANKVGGALSGVTSGFALGAGVMGAFGADAEKLEETLLKVNSAMAMVQGLQGIKESIPSFKAMGKSAATALSGIKTGIAATGIGVLLIAIGAVAANWDKISDALFKVDERQGALNATIDDYRTGIADATKKTNEVQVAFNLAKKGVISKEEALKKYNTSLGKSFGAATNLNDAEKLFNSKTKAYVKAAGERARATALMAQAAQLEADKVTASMDNQIGLVDAFGASFSNLFGGEETLVESSIRLQKKGVKEFEKDANKKIDIYNKEAEKSLETAETLEVANDITSDAESELADERASRWEAQKARLAEEKAILDAQAESARQNLLTAEQQKQDSLDRIAQAEYEATTSAAQQEIDAVTDKYFELITLAEQHGENTAILTLALNEELAAIEAEKVEAQNAINAENKAKQDEIDALDKQKKIDDAEEVAAVKQQLISDGLDASMTSLNTLDELNTLLTDNAVAKAGTNEAAAEAARKKGFERSKKLQMTMAVITGIQGVMAAFTAGSSMGPAGVVMGPVMAALAAVGAAVNIGKISKMKYDGGGGSAAATVGAAPSVPNPASFDVVGNSDTNQLSESLSSKPVKAYVVGGDVTTQQSLDRNKIETASM